MTKRDEELTELLLGTVDTLDFQRELSPGVQLRGITGRWRRRESRGEFSFPDHPVVELLYEVHGHTVTLSSQSLFISAPPASLTVHAAPGGDITTGVLRAIPLADARKRIKAMVEALLRDEAGLSAQPGSWYEVLSGVRMQDDEDWAVFARAYADLVAEGEKSPVTHLANALDLSRNTVAARVRIARDKGFLTRPTDESLGELTDKARELLDESED